MIMIFRYIAKVRFSFVCPASVQFKKCFYLRLVLSVFTYIIDAQNKSHVELFAQLSKWSTTSYDCYITHSSDCFFYLLYNNKLVFCLKGVQNKCIQSYQIGVNINNQNRNKRQWQSRRCNLPTPETVALSSLKG